MQFLGISCMQYLKDKFMHYEIQSTSGQIQWNIGKLKKFEKLRTTQKTGILENS